ncbi:MAG: hypothetical protein M3Z01_08540 [Thermoproteota archaeon]|nr:hypothetical protein [Thermoproteota archaeon]
MINRLIIVLIVHLYYNIKNKRIKTTIQMLYTGNTGILLPTTIVFRELLTYLFFRRKEIVDIHIFHQYTAMSPS